MINKKLVSDFASLIGNLEIVINLDSLNEFKTNYQNVLNEIINWVNYYYKNNNLSIIKHDNSLRIHDILEDLRNNILFDKEIGIESVLSDDILIRYEVIIKTINDGIGVNNG